MRPHQFIRGGWCVRVESGGLLLKEPRERKSIDIFGWRRRRVAVSKTKNPRQQRGARKGDLCFETHRGRPAISPRFDDVKDDDDDEGEFCFGRERGFKKTLEREV